MKGRGVLVSKYIGRLIATLLPLRLRILAVNVLKSSNFMHEYKAVTRISKNYSRETSMWVYDFIWQE